MSEMQNDSADGVEDNLDLFSADFFGQKDAAPEEPASSQEEDQTDDDTDDAPQASEEVDTHDNVDDAPEEGDDETEEDEPEPQEGKEEPKKKNRFQERIDEVVGKQREAERRAAEFEQRLNDALAKLEKQQDNETKPSPVKSESDEPSPTDKNEDGTDKYPLGEFDPSYIKDLTKYAFESQRISAEEKVKQEAEQRQMDEARAALQEGWQAKLGPAQERYPDFQQKGEELLSGFSDLDQAYGEYLTARLMDMEFGPDVLYYLASNPDEARKIVDSGPAKATLALGRIEAKFMFAEEEKKLARPKTSKAPPPPPHANKGSAGVVVEVPDDTEDLDAFSRKLFKKK